MRLFFNLTLLILYITTTQSSIYNNLQEDVLSFLKRSIDRTNQGEPLKSIHDRQGTAQYNKKLNEDYIDQRNAKSKAKILRKAKKFKEVLNNGDEISVPSNRGKNIGKEHYRMDPVLNFLKRRSRQTFRRNKKDSSTGDSSSSSVEMKEWKDEWREKWIQKKFEAINSSEPKGDVVNMVAARPWGVPCGDPNQHDMPWGTCMLPMECESEYRIYRGDYLCGRTTFVCCSLQLNTYDMYQGFDVSFANSELSSDSAENKNRGSKEKKRSKKGRERKRRGRERLKRKRTIKKNIRKITREIKKILNRSYRNGTTARKRKKKQLKRFINDLKDKYSKDRESVKDIHELELLKIDAALQNRLNEIKGVNQNFIKNSTFREIVVNGTITKPGARMLVQAYPELISYFKTRRSGDLDEPVKDYLDYDIEYGMLYY